MTDLLINPVGQGLINSYLARPSHGLLLSGPVGVGLRTTALSIAARIDPHTYTQEVCPDEKHTIPIETIRGLYALTRSRRDAPLVIIIDDSEAMGREAQNALLKLLEEPGENIYFILTSHVPQRLLPTITSRTQHIALTPLPKGQTDIVFTADIDDATKSQVRFLADGLPAEATRLLSDTAYFARKTKLMSDARAYLESEAYARLLLVKEYGGDRELAEQFLTSLATLLQFMLLQQQEPRYIALLEMIEEMRGRLNQNAHVRTQLTYLVMQS